MKRYILSAALLAAVLFPVAPDLYDSDRPLHTIETVWFDLIFPEESAAAAQYLASFADDMYLEIATLLDTTPRHRLPVIITPDHEAINGYFTNFPYLRIVLYQAAINPVSSLGNFSDDLRSLFMHELTHAVSLTIRGPIQEALVTVFGSPLGLSMYTTPMNFVEGVTVSFESLGGFGRTTDPLAAALIRQDLLEGSFKSFTQTMGTWDQYPGWSLFYIYGGYFSQYLQKHYGMEKYAQLWHRIGSGMLTRPLDDFLFIQGHFRKVYGLSLREAWAAFGDEMKPRMEVLESNPLITRLSSIETLAAGDTNLYWADSVEGAVFYQDPISGLAKRLFSTGATITRLDPDTAGSRMLVSATAYEAGYARLSLYEWDDARSTLTRLPYSGLRDASYLPAQRASVNASHSFLAIEAQGYVTSVVLATDGSTSPLLTGSHRVSYASPVAGSDGWIYTLVKEDGKVSLMRFRLDDGGVAELQRLRLPEGLGWIRYLSVDDGILRFSWDDEAFYRLAELEGELLRYQTIPVSGGVHQAVGVAGSVYYLGRFSQGTALCALPDDRSKLGFLEVSTYWEPAEKLRDSPSVYLAQEGLPEHRTMDWGPSSQDYSSLSWLLPRFWHPVMAGDANGLTLAGAAVYFADPIERVSGYLSSGWNPRTETLSTSFGLDLGLTPLLLYLTVWDKFFAAPTDLNPDRVERQGNVALALAATVLPFGGGSVEIGLSGALQGWAESRAVANRYGDWDLGLSYASLYAILQNMKQVFGKPGLHSGYSAGATIRSLGTIWPALDGPLFGMEVQVSTASRFLGFELSGYAALSLSEGLQYGQAGASILTPELGVVSITTYPLYTEFEAAPAGVWHLQGEASLRLLSFEIQQAAGPLYARRLDLHTGSRGILTSGTDWTAGDIGFNDPEGSRPALNWSLFSRLELAFTPAIGALALSRPVAWFELWYRPLDETWGLGYVRELAF